MARTRQIDKTELDQSKKTDVEKIGFEAVPEVSLEYNPVTEMINKQVFFIEPLSLALSTGRRDPVTGLPGIPLGSKFEIYAGAGKGKSACSEHFVKNVLKSGIEPTCFEDPAHEAIFLFYEKCDPIRFNNWIISNGLEAWRKYKKIYKLDQADADLITAEDGLTKALKVGKMPNVKVVVIDSLAAMAAKAELLADKKGAPELRGVEKKAMLCSRAAKVGEFMTQWEALDPNTRPVLCILNHYYSPVQIQDWTAKQFDSEKIGKDLNPATPGGNKKTFFLDYRFEFQARRWWSGDEKHPLYGYRNQKGLEIEIDVIRNRTMGKLKGAKGYYNMEDLSNCHFDLEEEILDICEFLNLRGVYNPSQGRWAMDDFGGKSYYKSELCEKLRANPDLKWEIIKEIAPLADKLFRMEKVKRDPRKEDRDSSKAAL